MRRTLGVALLGLLLATGAAGQTPSQAPKPSPAPIRAFDIPTIERLGQEIYRQDSAAWVATDSLQAKAPDLKAAHAIGWIVVPHGQDERVRFLRDLGNGPEVAWDIDVDAQLHTIVSEPAQRQLTPQELAAFTARQTAAKNVPGVCRPGYNSVVTHDPEGDGWLVWLLAPMPSAGAYPIGGHYRFTISADGKTVLRRDALFASCIVMDAPKTVPAGSQPAAMVVTHVVSPTPVETHVFIQLQAKTPMYVLAGDHVWVVEAGKITDRGTMAEVQAKAKKP